MATVRLKGNYGPALGSEIEAAGLSGLPMIAWSDTELRYEADDKLSHGLTAKQVADLETVIAAHDHTAPAPPDPDEVKAQEIKAYADSLSKMDTTGQKTEVDKQEFQDFVSKINDLSALQIARIDKVQNGN